jgi:hypothetical protein
MPDRTLAALVERSCSVLEVSISISIGSDLSMSKDERCEVVGGKKGGGTA